MRVRLSKEEISSFVGDVLPISLVGDGIDKDSEVSWSIVGDAAVIRTFDNGGAYSFKNGALITLVAPGEATVCAELNGEKYEARIKSRQIKHAESSDDLRYYFGDMHDHTSMNHNQAQFATHNYGRIEDYLEYIDEEGMLDFGVISDHAGVTNDYDFFRGFQLVRDEKSNDDGVIVFAGAESEITYTEHDRLDVLHRLSGEIVTINSAGYSDCHSWDEFYRDMSYSPRAVAIFAHPHVVGFSTNGIWNFNFMKNNTPRMLEMARGIEMGNGEDRKENLLHEYAYSAALDAGFRVSTTCGSDSHGPEWGYGIMPGKTVIMAPERGREAFLDALINNRFYATESGNVRLRYCVNGSVAPADLAPTDSYHFHIELSCFKDDESTRPNYLEIISDYGIPVLTAELDEKESFDFTVKSETARYFYLRLVDKEGRKTWSMPVFCGRAYDKVRELAISPIDVSGITARVDGVEQPKLVNGDPFDSWCGTNSRETVDMDLGSVQTVCAVGYYPHIVLRGKDKGSDWTTSMESAGLVSRYSVSVSVDGINYVECKKARAQTLGSENIVDFEPKEARFVRFVAESTIGEDSRIPKYRGTPVKIANLTVFTPAK